MQQLQHCATCSSDRTGHLFGHQIQLISFIPQQKSYITQRDHQLGPLPLRVRTSSCTLDIVHRSRLLLFLKTKRLGEEKRGSRWTITVWVLVVSAISGIWLLLLPTAFFVSNKYAIDGYLATLALSRCKLRTHSARSLHKIV